jgi:hypothetical protein
MSSLPLLKRTTCHTDFYSSLNFGNRYLRHVPETLADHLRQAKAACAGHRFGSGPNPAQTGVSDEELRERALQDDDPDAVIGLELPVQVIESLRQNIIEKIYRRVIDADECDPRINASRKHLCSEYRKDGSFPVPVLAVHEVCR